MDPILPIRRHIPHWEYPGGMVCLTWRLARAQAPLRQDERTVVLDVIRRSDPLHWDLIAAVVMDDHVHALGSVHFKVTARQTVQAMKSVASHELCQDFGRRAPLWQSEYFDRWMNSPAQTTACRAYVLRNPQRRWPDIDRYEWVCSKEPPEAP